MTDSPEPDSPELESAESEAATTADIKRGRRLLLLAALALLASAVVLWVSSRMTWAEVYTEDGQGRARSFHVLGVDWSPWLIAVAAALLAACGLQFVLKGTARRVLAIIVAVGALAMSIPALSLITAGQGSTYAANAANVPANYTILTATAATWPGIVVLVSAVLALVGAVAMMRSATSGSKRSSKYQSPAARRLELERRVFAEREANADGRAAPKGTERELWEALDHGLDPTDD